MRSVSRGQTAQATPSTATAPTPTTTAHRRGLAWARNVVALVEEICVEQLPAAATERLRERRDREQAERAQADANQRPRRRLPRPRPHFEISPDAARGRDRRLRTEHPAGDFLLEQLQTRHDELVEREAGAALDAMQPEPVMAA